MSVTATSTAIACGPDANVVATVDAEPTPRRAEKRVRDAYICFWANKTARDKLDQLAKERGVTRSEMARTVFGYGLAQLGAIK